MKKIRCISLFIFVAFMNIEMTKENKVENKVLSNYYYQEKNCGLMKYSDAVNYSKQKFLNSNNSSVKVIEKMIDPDRFPENYKFVQSQGFNQGVFNYYYNESYKNTPFKFDGTCSETAVTMVFWNEYRRIKGVAPNKSSMYYFNSSLNYAIANNYFPTDVENDYNKENILTSSMRKGTLDDATINIERYLLNGYLEDYNFWKNSDRIYQGVKDFTDVGKVQAFKIPGHLMMAIGYMRVPVQYLTTEGWWFAKHYVYHLDYVDFLICCNGWEESFYYSKSVIDNIKQGAYFPVEYINSDECYVVGMGNVREDSGK